MNTSSVLCKHWLTWWGRCARKTSLFEREMQFPMMRSVKFPGAERAGRPAFAAAHRSDRGYGTLATRGSGGGHSHFRVRSREYAATGEFRGRKAASEVRCEPARAIRRPAGPRRVHRGRK